MHKCSALMDAAIRLCHDPAFALHFGASVKTEDLSVVLSLVGAAPTIQEAAVRMNRHRSLVLDDGLPSGKPPVKFVTSSEGVWVQFDFGAFHADSHWIEASMAWVVCETRRMLDTHHGALRFLKAVQFTFDEPNYRAEYNRVFGVPVMFGAEHNALLVTRDFPYLSMPPSNPEVSRILREHVDKLEDRLKASRTTRMRVETVLLSYLRESDAAIKTVSTKLGISRQTLARRLAEEHTTFEKVKDQLRHELAVQYLAEKKLSVSETTYLLGFSDPAAFSRAFKRWTGASPRNSRNK